MLYRKSTSFTNKAIEYLSLHFFELAASYCTGTVPGIETGDAIGPVSPARSLLRGDGCKTPGPLPEHANQSRSIRHHQLQLGCSLAT